LTLCESKLVAIDDRYELIKEMAVKNMKTGFTLVELLTVLAIISLLVGLIIPSLTMVRKLTKETRQKAQFNTIEMALLVFKNDHGDYPRSNQRDPVTGDIYCGTQKLTEALLGWDLMGFHPDSRFQSDGRDGAGNVIYPRPLDPADPAHLENLDQREDLYLDLSKANAFRLGVSSAGVDDGLFQDPAPLAPHTYVICDSFAVKSLTVGTKTFKAGTPILYYRADTSSKIFHTGLVEERIYDCTDNSALLRLGVLPDAGPAKIHPLTEPGGSGLYFYDVGYKIVDMRASMAMGYATTGVTWPHRPDSYILISAGYDGLYGTADDICNFDN